MYWNDVRLNYSTGTGGVQAVNYGESSAKKLHMVSAMESYS